MFDCHVVAFDLPSASMSISSQRAPAASDPGLYVKKVERMPAPHADFDATELVRPLRDDFGALVRLGLRRVRAKARAE
jgi:hypothetical protein